jgi:phosphate starvation-inducible PhoH-like protein
MFDERNDALGDVKRRGRKPKKAVEKEIMKEYIASMEIEKPPTSQRKIYENIQYLSPKERQLFDQKFTPPKNQSQEKYAEILRNKHKKIVIATGPAGTGKTLMATECGVRNFLTGVYEKLIFTRPSVTVDEDLGFLPGTLEDKMMPWIRPIYDILYKFMSAKEVQSLLDEHIIEIAPLGFMRGRTFKDSYIIADEMQNSTVSQMKMLLTRIGDNSRIVITGDLDQHDRPGETNGLEDFLDKFRGKRSNSIHSIEFRSEDIQREEVVKEVLEIYSGAELPVAYTANGSQNSSVKSLNAHSDDDSIGEIAKSNSGCFAEDAEAAAAALVFG